VFLPVAGMLPDLTPEEIARFVALGEEATARLRAGDPAGAIAARKAQPGIYSGNHEPYVELAFLEAAQGLNEEALDHLRAAVVRGFTDMARFERAEAWSRLRGNIKYTSLRGAVPALAAREKRETEWIDIVVTRSPESLAAVLDRHAVLKERIARMRPALGPRMTRLWNRWLDHATAPALESYIAAHPDAADVEHALAKLMTLYTEGSMLRWRVLPASPARRLEAVARVVLERFPDGPLRPDALVCRALSRNAARDPKTGLAAAAVAEIRTGLTEVLARYPESPHAALAAIGLVQTEMEGGGAAAAGPVYRKLVADHAEDETLIRRMREGLGVLALRLGGMPEFQATDLDGTLLRPQSLRGRVVVLDFWATWCRPCVEQFPALRRIEERHASDVVLLGVNLDHGEDLSADALREWVERERVPGRQIHDGRSWESDVVRAFGVEEIPFTVVVAADGAVLAVNQEGAALERTVRRALAR
jgi:thiol-disulfide isomerase/thioredoxin